MDIIILDSNLVQVSILSSFISLKWTRQFSAQGSFEIVANMNTMTADELQNGRIVYLDEERAGIIESVEITRETNKSGELVTATGIELKDIIKRRVTVPPAGLASDDFVGQTIESIIRSLLEHNIIEPADTNRKVDILSLGPVNGIGDSIDYSSRYTALDTEIYSLLQSNMLGLHCSVDLIRRSAAIEVRAGTDRTIKQTDNPTAIFSLKLGTSRKSVILADKQAMKNIAYVGGPGEGTDRTVIMLPEDGEPVGFDRREIFVDASRAKTEDEILARGNAKLAELGSSYTVEGQAANTILEYALGDIVTVADYRTGSYENLQITAITDTYQGAAAPERSLTFGRSSMDIAQAINLRMSGVNNLITR